MNSIASRPREYVGSATEAVGPPTSPLESSIIDATKRATACRERLSETIQRAAATRNRLVGNHPEGGIDSSKSPRPMRGGATGDLQVQLDGMWDDLEALSAALAGII